MAWGSTSKEVQALDFWREVEPLAPLQIPLLQPLHSDAMPFVDHCQAGSGG
jgi:hypothetical protein